MGHLHRRIYHNCASRSPFGTWHNSARRSASLIPWLSCSRRQRGGMSVQQKTLGPSEPTTTHLDEPTLVLCKSCCRFHVLEIMSRYTEQHLSMLSSCTLIHRVKIKEVNHLHKHQHLEKELYKELCQLPKKEGLSASFILDYLQFQFGL